MRSGGSGNYHNGDDSPARHIEAGDEHEGHVGIIAGLMAMIRPRNLAFYVAAAPAVSPEATPAY